MGVLPGALTQLHGFSFKATYISIFKIPQCRGKWCSSGALLAREAVTYTGDFQKSGSTTPHYEIGEAF